MKASANTHERYRVGDLELDAGTVTVRRGDEDIALPGLSFELLMCLARHAPNVVSTDTLMDEVWGQVVVGEETVKQRVTLLRKALGDDSSDPRYIAAVRGRGYRLLADVSPLEEAPQAPTGDRSPFGSARVLLVAIALLALIGIGFLAATRNDVPGFAMPGTDSVITARGSTDNSEAWGAYLKGRAAYRRWTRQDNETALAFYQRAIELDPGFALAIAGAANANALRATEFGLGDEWIDEAIGQARQALALEPELPEALKALGICYVYKGQYQTALDYYRNALQIEPGYDEVLFNTAEILQLLGRWDEAVEYQRQDTDRPQGQERLAIYLRDLGFNERAEVLEKQYEEDLPVSYFSDASRSLHDVLEGDYEQARIAAHRMQRALPGVAGGWLREGEIDLFAGDLESAAAHFETALQVGGGFEDYARLRMAQLQWLAGEQNSAESLLIQVQDNALQAIGNGHEGWFHRWNMAIVSALRGNLDEALDWYEEAVESGRRRFEWDEQEPAFQPLRDEPRFEAALQRQRSMREEMHRKVVALFGAEN